MSKIYRRRRAPTIAWLLATVMAASLPAAADDGQERAKEFHEKIDKGAQELDEARKRFEKAARRYDDMLSATSNKRKDRYEDFTDLTSECEDKRKRLEERHKEMAKQADEFFDAWRKSSKKIEDGELRRRSETRLDASRARFELLSNSYRDVIHHYEPLTKAMRDQIVYLSHDLSDEAAASLSEDAIELRAHVAEMLQRIDDTRQNAARYMTTVKP